MPEVLFASDMEEEKSQGSNDADEMYQELFADEEVVEASSQRSSTSSVRRAVGKTSIRDSPVIIAPAKEKKKRKEKPTEDSGHALNKKSRNTNSDPPKEQEPFATNPYQRALDRMKSRQEIDAVVAVPETGADEDGEEENIKDQWEFVPFDEVDWTLIVEEDCDDPDWCFFCEYGQNDKEKEANPYYERYWDFLMNAYPKMKPQILGIKGRELYNEFFRDFTDDKKPMRAETVVRHLEEHAPSARIQTERMNRTLNRCMLELDRLLKQREKGTGSTRLHNANTALYLKLVDKTNEVLGKLIKMRPEAKK